jgi:hypothetical protein
VGDKGGIGRRLGGRKKFEILKLTSTSFRGTRSSLQGEHRQDQRCYRSRVNNPCYGCSKGA